MRHPASAAACLRLGRYAVSCSPGRAMEGYHKPDQQKLQALKDTANRLRISSIQATTAAGSG